MYIPFDWVGDEDDEYYPEIEHLGSITFNDWEKEDLEERPKRKKIPFGFRAPELKKPSNRQRRKRAATKQNRNDRQA